jgi:hypothetical protein
MGVYGSGTMCDGLAFQMRLVLKGIYERKDAEETRKPNSETVAPGCTRSGDKPENWTHRWPELPRRSKGSWRESSPNGLEV